jgi:type I restriction enzyme M protein
VAADGLEHVDRSPHLGQLGDDGVAQIVEPEARQARGDQIDKRIIARLANANKLSDFPDFNDAAKLAPVRRWSTGSPTSTESGRSKGQFYTPAEVSRVLAK